MSILDNHLDSIKAIAKCIAAQFGPSTEVVVHDFRNDYTESIIAIENGHITNRKVGDCATNLWLKNIKSANPVIENFGYITHTPDGKTLRSSTVNFTDSTGNLTGSICINQDISDIIQLEKIASKLAMTTKVTNNHQNSESNEIFTQNVTDLLEQLIGIGLSSISSPVDEMNKEAKKKFISFLDDRGAFLIQKSGVRVCELLGISKFTLYNYLDEIRKK